MRGRGQASFATVAGATAVETGHVNAVQVIVDASPRGARLVLSVFLIRPSGRSRGGRGHERARWTGGGEGRGGRNEIQERQQSVNMWLKRRSGEGRGERGGGEGGDALEQCCLAS